jgi:hypothetical protein
MAQVYMGERVVSFRALIKRYFHAMSLFKIASGNNQLCRVALWFIPPLYSIPEPAGVNAYGVAALGGVPVMTTAMQWCTSAYAAVRGSVRYKASIRSRYPRTVDARAIRGVDDFYGKGGPILATNLFNGTPNVNGALNILPLMRVLGSNGQLAQAIDINPVLDFSVPFYSKYKFAPTTLVKGPVQTTINDVSLCTPIIDIYWVDTGDVLDIDVYNAAGDDYDCVLFLATPWMLH